MKNISFVLFLSSLLVLPNVSFAMKISEIMYDVAGTDTGREWIEVLNDTSAPVKFSGWKFLENAVNHTLKLSRGDEIIPAGGYVIIADNDVNFLIDNPNFTGTLFDSAFSLANTGETVSLVNESGLIIDQVSYNDTLGAKGDGNSLQLYEGVFISALPTPAVKNATKTTLSTSTTTSTTSTSNISQSTHSSPEPLSKKIDEPDFNIDIGRDRSVSIKTNVNFEPEIDDKFKSKSIRYLWSIGDGRQLKGKKIEYFYKYPGIYNVVLNASYEGKNAVSRALINVFKPNVNFEVFPDWIEFSNLSKSEINIGGWKLKSEDKTINFIFPQDTIISSENKILFDKGLLIKKDENIDLTTKNIKLYFSNGDILEQ